MEEICGFGLSLKSSWDQERLLVEQIDLLGRCDLGRKFFAVKVPTSVDEFREVVPLTTYRIISLSDDQNEDILPSKPQMWARTSGRSSIFDCKWAPYSREMVRKVGEFAVASFILASASRARCASRRRHLPLHAGPCTYFTGAIVARGLA
jgi:hypothetical protein